MSRPLPMPSRNVEAALEQRQAMSPAGYCLLRIATTDAGCRRQLTAGQHHVAANCRRTLNEADRERLQQLGHGWILESR